jgi:hypothetical protein
MKPRGETFASGSRCVARCFSPRLEYPGPLARGLKHRATPERRPPPNAFFLLKPKPKFSLCENFCP